MKVMKSFTVNGRVVEKVAEFAGLVVYVEEIEQDMHKYYFSKDGNICQTFTVEAAEGQGVVFLCGSAFEDV
jgi:hypothetical protein